MKKNIGKWVLMGILTCSSMGAQAQNLDYDTKHDIAISYGAAPLSTWVSVGTTVITTIFTGTVYKYEESSSFGSLSAEYFYHTSPSLSFGAIACFSQNADNLIIDGKESGERKASYITVMPAVKWEYLRRKNFGMYSKLGIGYTLEHVSETYNGKDDTNNSGFLNFQISALGIEAGSKQFRCFGELGYGEQGILLAGLRYKF